MMILAFLAPAFIGFFILSFFVPTAFAVAGVLILSMTMGLFQNAGLPLALPKAIEESLMMLLLFKAAVRVMATSSRFRSPGWWAIGGSVLCGTISALANDGGILVSTLYVRNTLNFYLLFLAVMNLPLQPEQGRRLLLLVAGLFALQIPAGLIDFLINGIEEKYIGTVHESAGQLGLLIPMVATSFLFSAYLHTRGVRYLVGIMLFILFGVLGEKRATVFVVPTLLAILVAIYYVTPRPGRRSLRFTWRLLRQMVSVAVATAVLGGMAFYLGARLLPSLNPDGAVGGRFDPAFVLDYAQRYNTRDFTSEFNGLDATNTGVQMGRVELLKRSFALMKNQDPFTVLFGYGGGFFSSSYLVGANPEIFFERFEMRGTFPSIAVILLESGFLGAALYLVFHAYFVVRLYQKYRNSSGYYRIIGLGTLGMSLTFLFDTLSYSTVFASTGVLTPTYYLLAACLLSQPQIFSDLSKRHVAKLNAGFLYKHALRGGV